MHKVLNGSGDETIEDLALLACVRNFVISRFERNLLCDVWISLGFQKTELTSSN